MPANLTDYLSPYASRFYTRDDACEALKRFLTRQPRDCRDIIEMQIDNNRIEALDAWHFAVRDWGGSVMALIAFRDPRGTCTVISAVPQTEPVTVRLKNAGGFRSPLLDGDGD